MKEEDKIFRLERDTACLRASEPSASSMAAVATYDGMSYDDDIASDEELDNLDWSRFPSFGPFLEEEAVARIEEAEKDLEDPSKWIRIDDIRAELRKRHPWL